MHYLLLHEITPDLGPFEIFIFLGFVGVAGTLVAWIRWWIAGRRGKKKPELPPTFRILAVFAVVSGIVVWKTLAGAVENQLFASIAMVYLWTGFPFALLGYVVLRTDELAFWFGDTIAWSGVATSIWWAATPIRRRVAKPAPPVEIFLESEVRSQQDACDRCRAAAATPGIGEPMVRVAHTSDGPKFLYRCSACHSYWLRELKETRVISVVSARLLFPNAVG